jgi:hypothetical protein
MVEEVEAALGDLVQMEFQHLVVMVELELLQLLQEFL